MDVEGKEEGGEGCQLAAKLLLLCAYQPSCELVVPVPPNDRFLLLLVVRIAMSMMYSQGFRSRQDSSERKITEP